MHWNGFGRSLGFAAFAALCWWMVQPAAAAAFGTLQAFRLYLAFIFPLYVLGLGMDRGRAIATSFAFGLAATAVWLLPFGLGATCILLALGLAIARSGRLHRARPLRAWTTELILLGGGLGLASLGLHGATTLAFGVWGFFLVQSAFFLIGGVERHRPEPPRDAFEQARARLESLFS